MLLCVNCFHPRFPGLHFCHVCMAPVGDHVTYLPYERIWAEAWIFWKAAWSLGTRPWHAWTVALSWALEVTAFGLLWAMRGPPTADVTASWHEISFVDWSALVVITLSLAYTGVLAWRTVRHANEVAPDLEGEWAFGAWDDERGRPVDDDA